MVTANNVIELQDKSNLYLINSNNGRIIKLSSPNIEIWECWKTKENIECKEEEKNLFEFLLKNGYLYNLREDEIKEKENLISRLRKRKQKIKTTMISFVLTYDCNFACPYCYEKEATDSKRGRVITQEMVDSALALHGEELQEISFFGGEPLLEKNREIIKYIISKRPEVSYSALTNGYYLEEFFDIFSTINTSYIQVTLDGNEMRHNQTRKLRGGGVTFQKIMRGVKLYIENGIHIKFRMNISRDNLDECQRLRSDILEQYADYPDLVSFELYPIFQLKEEDKTNIFSSIYKNDFQTAQEKKSVDLTNLNNILSTAVPIVNFFATGAKPMPIINYCDAHTSRRFYDPLGNIYSCILSVGHESAAIGTYFPQYEIKKNSIVYRDVTTIEKCKECKYSLLCGGGCPLEMMKAGKDLNEPNCGNVLYSIHKVIPCIIDAQRECIQKK